MEAIMKNGDKMLDWPEVAPEPPPKLRDTSNDNLALFACGLLMLLLTCCISNLFFAALYLIERGLIK